jgi:hypothetical protein
MENAAALRDDGRMLGRLRCCAPARVAAGLLVVSLTGAPRLAGALADRSEHRCTCAAGRGERACECPICRARATHARHADEKRPPCHGGAAVPQEKRTPPPAGAPCLTGACGTPDGPRAMVSGLEPFTLVQDGAPPALLPAEAVPLTLDGAREVPRAPEPPRPRA